MKRPHIHVLIDLERSPQAGGHVKCWERFAAAAATRDDVDLTLHVAGEGPGRDALAPHVRFVTHKPVFSTRKIPFLGHVPDHTDMASFHPALAEAIQGADLIHTTDAFFAYARTAEKIAATRGIPLTHSIHTDTVSYTALFTRSMLEQRLGAAGKFLNATFNIPEKAAENMRRKLVRHVKMCRAVMASRAEDFVWITGEISSSLREGLGEGLQKIQDGGVGFNGEGAPPLTPPGGGGIRGAPYVVRYRLGLDFLLFNPARRNRAALSARYGIPDNAMILMFAGRLDEGKNIYTLIGAVEEMHSAGLPVFLIAAGIGPASSAIVQRLPGHAATPGFLAPDDLALHYASADYLALPSKVETWSMAAAEALASGLPVIAAMESGAGRFIETHDAGMVVAGGSSADWAAALSRAHARKNDAAMQARARHAAKQHFPTWEKAFDEDFVTAWKKVLGF